MFITTSESKVKHSKETQYTQSDHTSYFVAHVSSTSSSEPQIRHLPQTCKSIRHNTLHSNVTIRTLRPQFHQDILARPTRHSISTAPYAPHRTGSHRSRREGNKELTPQARTSPQHPHRHPASPGTWRVAPADHWGRRFRSRQKLCLTPVFPGASRCTPVAASSRCPPVVVRTREQSEDLGSSSHRGRRSQLQLCSALRPLQRWW